MAKKKKKERKKTYQGPKQHIKITFNTTMAVASWLGPMTFSHRFLFWLAVPNMGPLPRSGPKIRLEHGWLHPY
jgi:hypothetical protein